MSNNDELRKEIEHMRQAAASVVFLADRLLMAHYGMPEEKRLILPRRERRQLAREGGIMDTHQETGECDASDTGRLDIARPF